MADYVKLPKIGLTMKTGTVVDIKKKIGDPVKKGEVVAEFETDKITGDAESPIDGTVIDILVAVGDEVEVLKPLVVIGEPGESMQAQEPEELPAVQQAVADEAIAATNVQPLSAVTDTGWVRAMPLARHMAKQKGIDLSDIAVSSSDGIIRKKDVEQVTVQSTVRATPLAKKIAGDKGIDLSTVAGTGPGGRIVKDDVLSAVTSTIPSVQGVTRKKLSGMRKVIAERLSQSKQTIPHVYFKSEVDATALLALKEKLKAAYAGGGVPKVTVNDILLKAIAATLAKMPDMYTQLDGDEIVYFDDVNLGMAVSVDNGLIVPVIRGADKMGLKALAETAAALVDKARGGRLQPNEYTGGNFTVSNLGASGIDEFSAIINPPEAAILAVGGIKEKVTAVDGQIVISPMMPLTLSVDHRLIDGALAAEFMKQLKAVIEDIYLALL